MDIKIFAKRLKECRTNAGLSMEALGELIGVNKSNISRYEKAERGPSSDKILALIELFNVNPAWLVGANVEKYLYPARRCKQIPVIGTIAAGNPIIAEENIVDYEFVDEALGVDYCLLVKGDSMINARINEGDLVFVKRQPSVENGELALELIEAVPPNTVEPFKI